MANTLPIFQAQPKTSLLNIENADGTTEQTLYTAGADGALIDSVAVTSDDTAAVVLNLYVSDGSISYPIGQVSVAAGAGTDGTTVAQNLLDSAKLPFLQAGGGLALGPNYLLKVAANAAVTATKTVNLTAMGGDY